MPPERRGCGESFIRRASRPSVTTPAAPSSMRRPSGAFGPPIAWPELSPEDADAPAVLDRCYAEVEAKMQSLLDQLAERRVPFLGEPARGACSASACRPCAHDGPSAPRSPRSQGQNSRDMRRARDDRPVRTEHGRTSCSGSLTVRRQSGRGQSCLEQCSRPQCSSLSCQRRVAAFRIRPPVRRPLLAFRGHSPPARG